MKIVKNPFFASCAARFAQIVFFRVKLLKIVRLVSNSLQNGKKVRFSWKLYKTLLFRSCAARFGQIAFLSVKVVKIVTLAWNSCQNGKTMRSLWKLYKTLVSGHTQHVLAKSHFWASKLSKSSHWPETRFKTGKQCAFHENCTKRSFQVMRSTFWPNRIFEHQSCQFVSLAWNSLQNGKTVRFPWKFYKTLFSDHAQHVLAKWRLWASNFSISSHWPEILFKTGKQCAFHEKLEKTLFSGHAPHVLAKSNLWASKFSK